MCILFTLATILAWGVWLYPAETIAKRDHRLLVLGAALGNLFLSAVVAYARGDLLALSVSSWGVVVLGGTIWSLGAICAFTATSRLGVARAMGLWAPINILISFAWGSIVFNELTGASTRLIFSLATAALLLITGLLIIIAANNSSGSIPWKPTISFTGLFAAIGAGVLWGSYFIPIRMIGASPWKAASPMAVGMVCSALIFAITAKANLKSLAGNDGLRCAASGMLWGIGNFSSLLLIAEVGVGKGFALAQLCLVVNALFGVYVFRNPIPGSRSAYMILLGCAIATIGGLILGLSS